MTQALAPVTALRAPSCPPWCDDEHSIDDLDRGGARVCTARWDVPGGIVTAALAQFADGHAEPLTLRLNVDGDDVALPATHAGRVDLAVALMTVSADVK